MRPRRLTVVLITLIWIYASALGLFIAWQTKIGPVLLKLSERHGVHTGDVVGVLVCWGWAFLMTGVLLRADARLQRRAARDRPAGTRDRVPPR